MIKGLSTYDMHLSHKVVRKISAHQRVGRCVCTTITCGTNDGQDCEYNLTQIIPAMVQYLYSAAQHASALVRQHSPGGVEVHVQHKGALTLPSNAGVAFH